MPFLSRAVLVLQGSGLGAAPEATQERLDAIQEKLEERRRILALPQRFAGSKQLSRREMEIENALFQGTDRHSFLRALYHEGLWAQGSSCLGSSTHQAVWEPNTFLSGPGDVVLLWCCVGGDIFFSYRSRRRVGSVKGLI